MISLRIRLKGFMSYRDEAELAFEDATLWVLSGPNGSGKSTIFNAICFALYGASAVQGYKVTDLINRASKTLLVEYDFESGTGSFEFVVP